MVYWELEEKKEIKEDLGYQDSRLNILYIERGFKIINNKTTFQGRDGRRGLPGKKNVIIVLTYDYQLLIIYIGTPGIIGEMGLMVSSKFND